MKHDIDPIELLVMWHRYESKWLPVDGYPSECPSTAGYRASRQYDSDNGAVEVEEYARLARYVGDVVRGIDEPYRTALCILARNQSTGAAVWRSVRLPDDRTEVAHITAEAVDRFLALL